MGGGKEQAEESRGEGAMAEWNGGREEDIVFYYNHKSDVKAT